MKVNRFLATLFFLGAFATTASAVPAVNISWDSCTGPSDKSILPGTQASLFASVLGMDQTHLGYQIKIRLATGQPAGLPDAWRFDPAGCQGSAFLTIDHLAPSAVVKVCPSLQGPLPSVQIKDFAYDAMTGVALTQLANAYPNNNLGNSTQINPLQRYFMGRWLFDHSFSVLGATDPGNTCGGLGAAVCQASVTLNANQPPASWVNLAQQEVPFAFQNQFVTTNGNVGGFCPGATPTVPRTWGGIKNQYH